MADTNTLDTVKYHGNQYVVIDTVLPGDQSYYVEDFNGRQGDNKRLVNVCLQNHGEFWNLGNYKVNLVGRDSKNTLKATQSAMIVDAVRGLIRLAIPAAFYQATGSYTDAFLQIVDDQGTIISSVRVDFDVLFNGTLISKVESQLYLGQISEFIKAAQAQVDMIKTDVESTQQSATAINDLLNTYLQTVKTNAAAVVGKDNQWSAKQTFTKGLETTDASVNNGMAVGGSLNVGGTITADRLAGKAMDAINQMIGAIPVVSSSAVSRDYTCGNGCSRPYDKDDLELQKIDLGNGNSIIVGSGTLNFDAQADKAATIKLPWHIQLGSGLIGRVFDYGDSIVYLDTLSDSQVNIQFHNNKKATRLWVTFFIVPFKY
ncbi:BppU family phage baseplate upper protein [Limosilactobacillus vaginalis]|uniref:BppU family phage baseplate upper protein n=1 Tax=Limosilactobacillus vaginalis TaxID=1633 RepID=A0ABT4K6J9_9LACO|nr:BppU family phage baseplate upper protein [Limosilactobacillus vaginalis]MCZ3746576.1 BppU family phage baseplate upper protein [Limosilactobacillus vaginalis]MCZ3751532.1 BppU family phage baseplate upper protein [Limosilactobacillus vaginalis]MCZ3753219.1 BppU family phage baseplate upper protein [Limosilactobacillus vaginalis]MCZ3755095.1 BppU family phage baseplate upper protein [Limosilactobacillus vaginalis]MCZ3756704.1 BppU family phage baseplate upper protein [Limosilactobacillus va